MKDQRLEDIEFHQEFVRSEKPSPLNMIREKEMELSGRVLVSKKEAERMVADARKQAAEITASAEAQAAKDAAAREKEIIDRAEQEAERTQEAAGAELRALAQEIDGRKDEAVTAVVTMVVDS